MQMESEGHEERYRAVVGGGPILGPRTGRPEVGQGRSLQLWRRRRDQFHPPHQGVRAARSGRFMSDPQEPYLVLSGTVIRDPISASEVGNEAREVVGQPKFLPEA